MPSLNPSLPCIQLTAGQLKLVEPPALGSACLRRPDRQHNLPLLHRRWQVVVVFIGGEGGIKRAVVAAVAAVHLLLLLLPRRRRSG